MFSMKIRTYFQTLIKSISSPQYYLDVLNARFSFSLKFFLFSYFLLAIIATAFYIQFDIPHYKMIFKQNSDAIKQYYPDQLKLSWDGKELKQSGPELVEVSYPIGIPHDGLPDKLAYIDASATSIDQITKLGKSNSLFAITKDTLYASRNEGGWSPLPLKETPGFQSAFTIDKTSLAHYLGIWETIFNSSLNAFTFIYPVAFFFWIGLLRLMTLAVNSVFVYYLLRLLGKNLPYKKVFQLGMHIIVVAGLLDILTSHVIPPNVEIGIYGVAFWLYLIVVLLSLWNVKNIVLMRAPKK